MYILIGCSCNLSKIFIVSHDGQKVFDYLFVARYLFFEQKVFLF